jgi:hypothetical protein
MKDYKVSAQSLISWQSKTRKREKAKFQNFEVQLEIAPTPGNMVG